MPTISVENYLKTIYHLQQRQGEERVKTKDIANRLSISLPSVTSMLKSLAEDDFVEYQKYKGVRLTDSGRRLALQVIRKHRLMEAFLVQTLDYSWDEVHSEAELLEHAISNELAARIERYLGHPRFDPHGDPIPTEEGEIMEREVIPMDQVLQGTTIRIERVLDQDPEVLRYLQRVGLVPNTMCFVQDILPFDGQMFLQNNQGDDIVISRTLATRMLVALCDEDLQQT